MTAMDSARLTLVMFLWAVCFPLIVMGIGLSPHITFAALRAGIAGVILVVIGLVLGQRLPRDLAIWGRLFGIGLGATTLGFVGMFHASEFVSPGIATVIANTQPLMAAAVAPVLLRERVGGKLVLSLVLGFGGVLLITVPKLMTEGAEGFGLGVGYLMVSAVGITSANVLMKKLVGKIEPVMGMGLQILLGGIPLGLMALVSENPTNVEWSGRFVLSLVGLAVFGTALVFWLWFSILERVDLARANSFTFLVSVFGLAIGVLFFGERIGGIQALGMAMIISGVTVISWRRA